MNQKLTMKSIVKKAILKTFGPPVRYVISQMQLHEPINKRLNILESILQDAYPAHWIVNERSRENIEYIIKNQNLPAHIDTEISKNDLMFRYFILNGFSIPDAMKAYFERSLHFLDILEKTSEKLWGKEWKTQALPMLDFASGYGAFERLLVHHLDKDGIYTSDIKKQAVDFQVNKFGVKGIYSTFVPEDFESPVLFKSIFVGSLFSHLPQDLFGRWLKKLIALTDKNGVLIFSVHDQSLGNTQKDFVYNDISEDSAMGLVEDSITNAAAYGTSFVSEKFVADCFQQMGFSAENYQRYPKLFCGLQDVYIFTHQKNALNGRIAFANYLG